MSINRLKSLRVIGEEVAQVVESTFIFTGEDNDIRVYDVDLEIINFDYYLFKDKVVLQGEIHANGIFYYLNLECDSDENNELFHCSFNLPFETEVEIEGLKPGLKMGDRLILPVQDAENTLDIQNYVLELDYRVDYGHRLSECKDDTFAKLVVLARILVKASRWEQTEVCTNEYANRCTNRCRNKLIDEFYNGCF
ncbi:DUF3794 domain-containing protein [Selenihalanaerobacter shriftii]|uniref:SipL SPOCS domain-containing protein n=1 Tax=Selenihalanaerobacter shriftii TaxID=142842 RepID=A0A1T4K8B5_9FIRM|nr:DUF3794 domain-containing protein [Selenihalanaerobacter shriftii]SJZ38688.1 protein of unknown function [Selenihalanaerobacter shriftii]